MTSPAEVHLVNTSCPICGTADNSAELFAPNFDAGAFTSEVFSARRLPDRIHYRMVSCLGCGLVRSDPVLSSGELAELYAKSTFTYGAEVANLRATYGRYLRRVWRWVDRSSRLLEIGCGNGFMLDEALRLGFTEVTGVEPGQSTVDAAPESVRSRIVVDIMRPGLFAPSSFDVVTLFQVLDHLPDPLAVLSECFQALRPGGVVLCFNHNVRALSARLLREASPIIDIEHTYLYSPDTMRRLLTSSGFETVAVGAAWNTLSAGHLAHLAPLPPRIKSRLLTWAGSGVRRGLNLHLPLGNLYAIGRRPITHD